LSNIQSKVLEGLHVYQSGAPGQPVLLFLHGSPLSGRMWIPQLERLEEFHCLAPDLPEHGQSQAVAPFSMDDTVRRLAAIVRGAGAPDGRAHIIGLSFGGVVAQALMVKLPYLADHVILSGTSARMSGALFQALRLSLALNRPLLRVLSPGALATLVRWQTGIPVSVSPLIEDDMKRVDPDSLTRIILATYGGIVTPTATRSPVLVLVGEKETPVARSMARRLQREIPGARGATVRRHGHIWNLENPDLFVDVVRAWVRDGPLPGPLVPFT
jgi:pimeloyl-ACP methyl ester carboxylesterase